MNTISTQLLVLTGAFKNSPSVQFTLFCVTIKYKVRAARTFDKLCGEMLPNEDISQDDEDVVQYTPLPNEMHLSNVAHDEYKKQMLHRKHLVQEKINEHQRKILIAFYKGSDLFYKK